MSALILRRLVKPHREEKKTTREESSNHDMPSHLNVRLGSSWRVVESEEKTWGLVLGEYTESVS